MIVKQDGDDNGRLFGGIGKVVAGHRVGIGYHDCQCAHDRAMHNVADSPYLGAPSESNSTTNECTPPSAGAKLSFAGSVACWSLEVNATVPP